LDLIFTKKAREHNKRGKFFTKKDDEGIKKEGFETLKIMLQWW
jgi:hypothetical protein